MNIGIIVFEDYFKNIGTTIRAQQIVNALSQTHNVTVINCTNSEIKEIGPSNPKFINVKNVQENLLPSRYFGLKIIPVALWNIKLSFILLKNRFDVLYSIHDFLGYPSSILAAQIKHSKLVFEMHSIISEESKELKRHKLRIWLDEITEKFIVSRSDHVIALSEYIFAFYSKYTKNIDVIPSLIDTEKYKSHFSKKDKNGDKKIIGLVGPFNASVRKESSLSFLYSNIDNFDDRIKFVIIGDCQRKINNPRITYSGYINSESQYIETLASLDALIIASEVDSFGPITKVIEAMSCLVPIFTTPRGVIGMSYLITGQNIVFSARPEMVEKVNSLIFDKVLMNKIANNALDTIEQHYSMAVNKIKLLEILTQYEKNKSYNRA